MQSIRVTRCTGAVAAALLLATGAVAWAAQEPAKEPAREAAREPVKVFTNADFAATRDALVKQAQGNPVGVAARQLRNEPGSQAVVIVRVKDGEVEQHDLWVDEVVVHEGEMDVVIGGTLVSPRQGPGAGEWRANSVTGPTTTHRVRVGETIEIATGVPHQVKPVGTTPLVVMAYKVK